MTAYRAKLLALVEGTFDLGGPGSGNFGHGGRPGEVGGSSDDGGDGDDGGESSTPTVSSKDVKTTLTPTLATAAQEVYDEWDESDVDCYAGGGICHIIAEKMAEKLSDKGIEAATVSAQIGEQHVWVVAKLKDGVYAIDIPPGTYETGGGYSWQKKKDVQITKDDVTVDRIDVDPNKFEDYLDMSALEAALHLGGPGSGNFGHGGRPGERGGSSSDGGMAARLPDTPDTYFVRDDQTRMLPLDEVVLPQINDPSLYSAAKARAVGHMADAASGKAPRREPLTVIPTGDGKFEVVDGLATVALIKSAGWKQIPVHVEHDAVLPGREKVTVGGREIAITKSANATKRGDLLVPVDVQAFDKAWQKDAGFHIDPSGKGKIANRLEGVQKHLATGTELDAAEVVVDADGRVGVKDGRHRMAVLRDAGVGRVPVAMTKESLAHAKKHGLVAKPYAKRHLTYREKLVFLLGGEGSGNFGHAGRPGEQGGSGPGEGGGSETREAKTQAISERILKESGGKLAVLDLRPKANGDVELETIAVAPGEHGGGVGTKAMESLTEWADDEGVRLILSPSQKGYQPVEKGPKTTSPARLKRFYKRFGFVEPKGRHYDPTLSSPTRPTMFRPAKKKGTHASDRGYAITNLGGPGSGNFGHGGRPGEVGGSSGGGGDASVAAGLKDSTNYHQGVYYSTKSGIAEIQQQLETPTTVQKGTRGFYLEDADGNKFGPDGFGEKTTAATTATQHFETAGKDYPKLTLKERDVRHTLLPRDEVYKGDTVDGLRVRTDIPNTDSISATFNEDEYEELPGLRSVKVKDLNPTPYASADDNRRVDALAAQIKESGEIAPLIVVRDSEGTYPLEGNHRLRALAKLGKTEVPALVIVHYDDKIKADLSYKLGGPGSGNFGHGGRPGEVGGSTGEGSASGPGAAYFDRNPSLAPFRSIPVVRSEGTGGRHPEAEVDSRGQIHLYPKFDKLTPAVQDFVFAHEVGHVVLDEKGLSTLVADAEQMGIDVWTDLPFGQNNMMEAFADSFASYHTDKEVVKRYPAWAKLVEKYAERQKKDLAAGFALGGPGSGNFGHAGRPGEVGGSGGDSEGGTAGKRTQSPQFKRWFKESEVVDEDGEPLRVYHGTTHDITQFKAAGEEGLNPESDWGAGVYFTSSSDDAGENYAGEGPDLTSRLESRADQIESEMEQEGEEGVGGIGRTWDAETETWKESDRRAAAMAQARAELKGKADSVIPAYLSFQKPFVVGEPNGSSPSKETRLEMEYEYDDPNDPDSDIIGEKGTLPDFFAALLDEAAQYDGGTEAADNFISRFAGEDSVTASALHKAWKESDALLEHPESGQIMKSEAFRAALQRAGFDSVVDRTVNDKFGKRGAQHRKIGGGGMEHLDEDTTHFIAFTPTQIKSAIGNVSFDPSKATITMSYRERLRAMLDLGGQGSGNFGHEGRPGEVGGSGEGGAKAGGAGRERFDKRWPGYDKEMDAFAAKHGEERLTQELKDLWANQDRTSTASASETFHRDVLNAGRKRMLKERRTAKQAEKDVNKPKIREQMVTKYGYDEGDVVFDSETGSKGVVKWGRDGQPFVKTNEGEHYVGSRWKKAKKDLSFRTRLELFQLGGAGSGNFGHSGRPGEIGGSGEGEGEGFEDRPQRFHDARSFDKNEGYDWHERPEMEEYAKGLPPEGVEAINSYASFGYGDVNRMLRGTYESDIVNETVRDATPEEIAAFKHPPMGHGQHASDYDESDSLNKVDDGRIVHSFHYEGGYKPNDPAANERNRVDSYYIEKAGPDEKREKQIAQTGERINTLIAEHGYALEEPVIVNRAAYVPGLSYDDLKAMEGATMEEKGFTSTMLGNPSNRLDGYVVGGMAESIAKRHEGSIYEHQDEVAAPMRIEILLPVGTKVAPVETLRRIDHEFPKIPDPAIHDHPEWLKNDDGTPNGLKPSDFTIRDRTAKPTVKTDRLHDTSQRSEAEILLGSGAQFRIVSVRRGDKRIVSSDPKLKPIDVIDVKLEYIGGGSSDSAATPTKLADFQWHWLELGGPGSGNFGHGGRPGEVGGSSDDGGGGEGKGESKGKVAEGPAASGGGEAAASSSVEEYDESSPIDMKRKAFMEIIKEGERHEAEVDTLRTEMNDAWQRWAEDTKNRKKPLKPDGAAAKKLPSYQEAKALEEQFHAKYEESRAAHKEMNKKAREHLAVPSEDRSSVVFEDSKANPLHPGVASGAKLALVMLRRFDGSGAFVPTKYPADTVEKFREAFGGQDLLKPNPDGTVSIPATIRLEKAEGGRSHATLGAVHIAGGRDLEGTVWHEVAHHIEMKSPAVLRAAVAFRESLADKPLETYKLNTVRPSLGDDEVALKGKFPDPYVGKLYPGDIATEIVSTGVHSYIADPVSFARDRPEHFKFIFDVMHGKYREAS